jgi:hypothetical protein
MKQFERTLRNMAKRVKLRIFMFLGLFDSSSDTTTFFDRKSRNFRRKKNFQNNSVKVFKHELEHSEIGRLKEPWKD